MIRKTSRANNAFLLGSLILIVLVLVIVVLFLFLSLKIYEKKENTSYTEQYRIELGTGTAGSPVTIYLNDSLLFNGTPQPGFTLSVGRFEEESSLLIVDGKTQIVSVIELPDHSQTVNIAKRGSEFYWENQE